MTIDNVCATPVLGSRHHIKFATLPHRRFLANIRLVAIWLTSLAPCAALATDAVSTTVESLDAIERRLETSRHDGLLKRIADPEARLNDFTSDGCSGGLSAGWEHFAAVVPAFRQTHGDHPPWEECCIAHDREYHRGGSDANTASESFEARKQADLALQACVLSVGTARAPQLITEYDLSKEQVETLYATIAGLMYRAVRLGGVPCSGLPWRWGYGWPQCE